MGSKTTAFVSFLILSMVAVWFYLWWKRQPGVPGEPPPGWPEGTIPVEPYSGGWWETNPADLKGSERVLVEKVTIDTSSARAAPGTLFNYVGSQIFVKNPLEVTDSVYIRFNNPSAQKFDLTKLTRLKIPFGQFYIENAAGTGTLELWISKGYMIEFTEAEAGNKSSVYIGQKDVAAAGTAEQLPEITIPHGFVGLIIARTGNTGDIYIGTTKARAEVSTTRLTLETGDSFPTRVTNFNLYWLDADNNDDGVVLHVEQES